MYRQPKKNKNNRPQLLRDIFLIYKNGQSARITRISADLKNRLFSWYFKIIICDLALMPYIQIKLQIKYI